MAITRDVAIVAGIVLFVYGWLFATFYYGHFGVGLSSLQMRLHDYYFYSWPVVAYSIRNVVWVFIVPALALAMLWYLKRLLLAPYVLASMFLIGGILLAYGAARDEALCTRQGFGARSVEFRFRGPSTPSVASERAEDQLTTVIERLNSRNELTWLTETADFIVVFHQGRPNAISQSYLRRAPVFFIPKSDIELAVTAAPESPTEGALRFLGGCSG